MFTVLFTLLIILCFIIWVAMLKLSNRIGRFVIKYVIDPIKNIFIED